MKEVCTKSFWQGVKKTFHEALEDPPPADNGLHTSAEARSERVFSFSGTTVLDWRGRVGAPIS